MNTILISYPNFLLAELIWPHKEYSVHPFPILLYNASHFETPQHVIWPLPGGFHAVGILDNYMIRKIMDRNLFLLMAPRDDLDFHYGRVKLHIHDGIANLTLPILRKAV